MAENLNYKTTASYCYNDATSNCNKYGRLYTWAAAVDSAGVWSRGALGCGFNRTCSQKSPVRGVCPEGWHLPSDDEWGTLLSAVGGSSTASRKLMSTSGWSGPGFNNGGGSDDFGFSALPAGFRDLDGIYHNEGFETYFWSFEEFDRYEACSKHLDFTEDSAFLDCFWTKDFGLSVRCVKD